ncbi:MAG: AzlC family ABC transporter permease [Lachnospiraceae bacterium]|jgi:predicted branched-subunit amino acid permease|nr:AzlC family ABC transporter permease [Lachnospiraceae bacterium]
MNDQASRPEPEQGRKPHTDTEKSGKTRVFSRTPDYSDSRAWFRRGLVDGIPIALGYAAVAFTLGIAARNAGFTALQGYLMSLGMRASAGEYAAILLIGSGAGIVEMVCTTLVINLRYFLMSCSLSQKLKPDTPLWQRFLLAICITDEIFGISSAVPGMLNPAYSYGALLVAGIGWDFATAGGILVGSILPLRLSSALSVSLYGMFLAIIIPPMRKSRFMTGLVAVSMAASWIFTEAPFLRDISSGFRVIILTVGIAGAAAVIHPLHEGEKQ